MYVDFVDFRKAFDSVRHCKLLETLQKDGVSGKFAGAIKAMYNSLLSCVRVKNEYTDFFECLNGVRQGCLFCLFINQLAEYIQSADKHGVQMLSGLIELFILLFADDVTLLATTPSCCCFCFVFVLSVCLFLLSFWSLFVLLPLTFWQQLSILPSEMSV